MTYIPLGFFNVPSTVKLMTVCPFCVERFSVLNLADLPEFPHIIIQILYGHGMEAVHTSKQKEFGKL